MLPCSLLSIAQSAGGGSTPSVDPYLLAPCDDGILLKTEDGINYSEFATVGVIDLTCSLITADIIIACGLSGYLATSEDGGVTWTERTSGFGTSTIYGIDFNETIGLFAIVGLAGKIATSSDGITWTLRTSGIGGAILDIISIEDRFLAVYTSSSQGLLKSTNGISWTVIDLPLSTSSFPPYYIANQSDIVITSNQRSIAAKSLDRGDTWLDNDGTDTSKTYSGYITTDLTELYGTNSLEIIRNNTIVLAAGTGTWQSFGQIGDIIVCIGYNYTNGLAIYSDDDGLTWISATIPVTPATFNNRKISKFR